MPSVNPGPASTATPSATAVLAPAVTPNFGNLYQGAQAYRCLAFGRQIPVNATGDAAFLPLINTAAFNFLPAASAILFANPGTLINGVFTFASIASTVARLWSGPAGTGLALCASTTLSTLSATTAATYLQVVTATALGYYQSSTWGVGQTNGIGGAPSNGIYVNIGTASGVTSSVVDVFVYGADLT